jgi:hypothetical protein
VDQNSIDLTLSNGKDYPAAFASAVTLAHSVIPPANFAQISAQPGMTNPNSVIAGQFRSVTPGTTGGGVATGWNNLPGVGQRVMGYFNSSDPFGPSPFRPIFVASSDNPRPINVPCGGSLKFDGGGVCGEPMTIWSTRFDRPTAGVLVSYRITPVPVGKPPVPVNMIVKYACDPVTTQTQFDPDIPNLPDLGTYKIFFVGAQCSDILGPYDTWPGWP